jgi:pyruvate dehydrogenase E2 component (dihydrolipoamide acetyltransferase)
LEYTDELRFLLDQYEIDIEELKKRIGSARITENDVMQYIKEKYYPEIKETVKLTPIKKTGARKLSESYRTAVHVTLFKTINVEPLIENSIRLGEYLGGKVSFTFMLLKPLAKVLEGSIFNSELVSEDKLVIYKDVNIAIAVETGKGLVTPVIRKVNERKLSDLYKEYVDIVSRARDFKLKQKDFVGATFTLTNLGMYNIDFFTQIINPPQTAILGVGKVREEIVLTPEEGLKKMRVVTFSLTFDHRIAGGAEAAIFLNNLEDYIKRFKIEDHI